MKTRDWTVLLLLAAIGRARRRAAPPSPNTEAWTPPANPDPDLNVPVVPLPPNPLQK